MKRLLFALAALMLLMACDKNDVNPDVRKERVNVELTTIEKEILEAGGEFAFNLYKEISKTETKKDNLIVSPLSVSLAFAMLNNGAAGETQAEIQKVLGFEGFSADDVNSYYQKMLTAAKELDPQVTLETANSIWVQQNFPIHDSFTNVNKKYFDAQVSNIDFTNPASKDVINGWVSDKTNKKIPKMFDQMSGDFRVLLLNAIYFLGKWDEPFDEARTKDKMFFNGDGSATNVPMMHNGISTHRTFADNYTAVRLPYGNGAFFMEVVLPEKDVKLEDVVAELSQKSLYESSKTNGNYGDVNLQFPRFNLEYDVNLIEILQALGMQQAFEAQADFSRLSDRGLMVDMVYQKATIEVTEKGTEAAAATGIGMGETSPGPMDVIDFVVDHPFLFMIREVSTGAVYFMGEVNKL